MKKKQNFDQEIFAEPHQGPSRESEVMRPLDFSTTACASEELAYRDEEDYDALDTSKEDFFRQTIRDAFLAERARRVKMRGRRSHRRPRKPERTLRLVVAQNIRARDIGAVGVLDAAEWSAWRDCFNGKCAYCGGSPDYDCIEHVVPLSRGGENTIYNVVPSCGGCNSVKMAKEPIAWMAGTARLIGFVDRVTVALGRFNEKTPA